VLSSFFQSHQPLRRGLFAFACCWVALQGCGDDGGSKKRADAGDDEEEPRGATCAPGRSIACTGRGGCAGHQVCDDDGRYAACDCSGGGSDIPLGDGGSGSDGDTGGRTDAGGSTMMTAMCGAACKTNAECGGGSCVTEKSATTTVEGLGPLMQARFPGGICSQVPLTRYESTSACDPSLPAALQGCGSCGVCTFEQFSDAIATVCREKCTPSATDNGCSRDEYTCSFGQGACIEGQCQTDNECRIYSEDTDNDGVSDALVFDSASKATCNLATRRCTVPGKAGAQAGDPCMRDDDCEADGFCLTESSGEFDVPFAGGYCAKRGCKVAGLECAGQGACAAPRAWFEEETLGTVCAHGCEQGKEAMADQTGVAGHGNTCRAGYMCMWNGTNAATGTCLPGNYNAVASNNVGVACKKHSECYSPFGHGRCANMGSDLASASFCSVFDCGTPGMPSDLCGTGNLCVLLDDDLSACLKSCTDASMCAAGLACVSVGQSQKACVFGCETNSECKTGETCSRMTGACIKA
jgi:hypothetical protein